MRDIHDRDDARQFDDNDDGSNDDNCSVCHARFPDGGDDVWRPGLCRYERRSL
jgi:hypothetical protein